MMQMNLRRKRSDGDGIPHEISSPEVDEVLAAGDDGVGGRQEGLTEHVKGQEAKVRCPFV